MIYDITQPLFECEVFPGDPKPEKKIMLRLEKGDVCNLTAFSMCAHNGTHVDAPFHFINDGKGIDKVALEKFIGPAYVKEHKGDVSASDAKEILKKAKAAYNGAEKKILNQLAAANEYGITDGMKVKLEKRIPVAAGMAGGSSDAAATLKAMNRMFDLEIPDEKLAEYVAAAQVEAWVRL